MSTDPPAEVNSGDGKPKTAAQLRKEQVKAEKLAKFEEKQKKMVALDAQKQNKPQKAAKATSVFEYTSATKPGEKKGML
jgi:valyl-tRNA synthetase